VPQLDASTAPLDHEWGRRRTDVRIGSRVRWKKMPTSSLPVWVSCVQALGLPIFGLVIAGASVYIAWQQNRIADIRLRHELYDRRLRVYEAAKTLLVAHLINGKLSGDDYIAYRRGTADAVFLLDAGVVDYLGEQRKKGRALDAATNRASRN
jgi:hypothetical protein